MKTNKNLDDRHTENLQGANELKLHSKIIIFSFAGKVVFHCQSICLSACIYLVIYIFLG